VYGHWTESHLKDLKELEILRKNSNGGKGNNQKPVKQQYQGNQQQASQQPKSSDQGQNFQANRSNNPTT
jgi:hypothetical protein